MNTYIAVYKSNTLDKISMMRVEAEDIWKANEIVEKLDRGYYKDNLITIKELNSLSLIK